MLLDQFPKGTAGERSFANDRLSFPVVDDFPTFGPNSFIRQLFPELCR
jgi:hypothetical protein